MRVIVNFKKIEYETEKAYLIDGNWFSKKLTEIKDNYIIIPEWLAIEKKVNYKPLIHIPERIEPEYNQEVLDELRY